MASRSADKDPTRSPEVNSELSSGERPTPKRIEWSDLTQDQRALLVDFEKNGIHLTPEQVLKIASGAIEYHRPPRSFNEEFIGIHVGLEKPDGTIFKAIEARAVQAGFARKHEANPDFASIWQKKDTRKDADSSMSASVNLRKGYISLAAHGGNHYIKVDLASYDEESWLGALIGAYYARRGGLPKRMKFTRKIRERAAAMYELLATAKANQAQTGTQWGPSENRGFHKISVRKTMQEKNEGRPRERYARKFSRTLIEKCGRKLIVTVKNRDGNVRKSVSYNYDDDRLWAWCEDEDETERARRVVEARSLKRYMAKARQRMAARGFTHRIAFCGIYRNPETGRREYRRTEVYKAFKWTRQEVAFLYYFFKKHVSRSRGAVFAFHNDKLYVDEKDPLAKFGKPVSQVERRVGAALEQRSGSYAEFVRRRHMLELASGDIQN
jgi:hypothetical protein